MLTRRSILTAAVCGGLLVSQGWSLSAHAADASAQPFTQAAFDAAQKAGKPILVDIYATWCDVCARQAPIIDRLHREAKFKDLVIFKVNFDTQKDVMRRFNARLQSTLISFRGTKEVARSVGETQPEWIEDQFDGMVGGSTT